MLPRSDATVRSPLDQRLQALGRLHPKTIDLSLDRIRALLARLGNPQRRLTRVAHVAGTNGKGSTVAFLRAITEAAGWRTDVYTSPHLVRFNERIRRAGRLIEDSELLDAIDAVERANGEAPITHFEFITALAFHVFAQNPADLVLLETGLGGRVDATNVIEHPAVTAITRISMDHCHYLGDTLVKIAAEKAGILKRGAPLVVAPQPDESVRALFRERARAAGVALYEGFADSMRGGAGEGGVSGADFGGNSWSVSHADVPPDDGFRYRSAAHDWRLPLPALLGAHQLENAGTALACLERIADFPLTVELAARGLRDAVWPGRLQSLAGGAYQRLLPPGAELWLDGGHNDSGGEVLALQARRWKAADARPLDLVVGMLKTKDAAALLRPLLPHARSVTAIAIPGDGNSQTAEALAAIARGLLPELRGAGPGPASRIHGQTAEVMTAEGPVAALAALATAGFGCGRVLICGSLHLAGVVLRDNGFIPA